MNTNNNNKPVIQCKQDVWQILTWTAPHKVSSFFLIWQVLASSSENNSMFFAAFSSIIIFQWSSEPQHYWQNIGSKSLNAPILKSE